jgi:L-ascorbate metabolism protein UlaG (beta-lactamase superfamily)
VHNGDASFGSFFTSEPPKPAQRYTGDGVRVRYYSHACLLIETRDVAILTDPVVSYRYPTDIQRYSYDDLPDVIDYVLISHNHQDHCMYETLLQLRHKIRTIIVPPSGGGIADPSLKLLLKHAGLRDVVELAEMDSLDVPSGSILAVPFLGEHADLDIRTKTGYLLQLAERSVYVAADSCNIEPRMYQALREAVGPIDVVFLGMECDGAPLTWLYGPLLFHPISRRMDRSRCFNGSNFEQAAALVEELAPKQVFIYAMGLEPWLVYLTSLAYAKDALPMLESDRLVAYCHARGIPAERLAYQRELVL